MSEPTQEEKKIKVKKPRTPEQLEVLANARKKALEIRRENAKLRQAEKDIEKDKKNRELATRKQKVEEYERDRAAGPPPTPASTPEPKKDRKKKIVYVEESESESESEEVIVKVKKRTPVPVSAPAPVRKTPAQLNYEKVYSATFGGFSNRDF